MPHTAVVTVANSLTYDYEHHNGGVRNQTHDREVAGTTAGQSLSRNDLWQLQVNEKLFELKMRNIGMVYKVQETRHEMTL